MMGGCATVSQQDQEVLRAHGVSENVYDKMRYGDALSLGDVIELSEHGVPAGLIVHYMRANDIGYRLRKADVTRLRNAGVSEDVIAYMLSTGAVYGGPVYGPVYGGYYGRPYPYGYGPYDFDYGYAGGPYIGPVFVVGGGYYHHGGWGHGGWGGHDRH